MAKVFITKTKAILGNLLLYAAGILIAVDSSQLPAEYRWIGVVLIGAAKVYLTSRVSESNPNGTPATLPSGEPHSPSAVP